MPWAREMMLRLMERDYVVCASCRLCKGTLAAIKARNRVEGKEIMRRMTENMRRQDLGSHCAALAYLHVVRTIDPLTGLIRWLTS
jgi:hypothetical protein